MKLSEIVNKFFQNTCHLPDRSIGKFKRAAIIVGLALFHTLTLGTVVLAHSVRNHSCCSTPVKNFDKLMKTVLTSCRKSQNEYEGEDIFNETQKKCIDDAYKAKSSNDWIEHILNYVKIHDDYITSKYCFSILDNESRLIVIHKLTLKIDELFFKFEDVLNWGEKNKNNLQEFNICEKLLGLFEEINQLES